MTTQKKQIIVISIVTIAAFLAGLLVTMAYYEYTWLPSFGDISGPIWQAALPL